MTFHVLSWSLFRSPIFPYLLASLGTCRKQNALSGYTDEINIKGKVGMIVTPDFLLKESSRIHRIDCMWTIEVPQGKRVRAKFRSLYIDFGRECVETYVLLGNGVTVADNTNVLAKICSSGFGGTSFLSSGRYLTVHFKNVCYNCFSSEGMMLIFEAENTTGKSTCLFRMTS